jgi:hypothetical protein
VALATDGADPPLYGTRGGQLYASLDDGQSWETVAEHLPPILSVRAAVV